MKQSTTSSPSLASLYSHFCSWHSSSLTSFKQVNDLLYLWSWFSDQNQQNIFFDFWLWPTVCLPIIRLGRVFKSVLDGVKYLKKAAESTPDVLVAQTKRHTPWRRKQVDDVSKRHKVKANDDLASRRRQRRLPTWRMVSSLCSIMSCRSL